MNEQKQDANEIKTGHKQHTEHNGGFLLLLLSLFSYSNLPDASSFRWCRHRPTMSTREFASEHPTYCSAHKWWGVSRWTLKSLCGIVVGVGCVDGWASGQKSTGENWNGSETVNCQTQIPPKKTNVVEDVFFCLRFWSNCRVLFRMRRTHANDAQTMIHMRWGRWSRCKYTGQSRTDTHQHTCWISVCVCVEPAGCVIVSLMQTPPDDVHSSICSWISGWLLST